MREPASELQIKDRYWYLKCYPQCFVGSEAVEFFRKTYSLSRKQAIKLGNKLLTNR